MALPAFLVSSPLYQFKDARSTDFSLQSAYFAAYRASMHYAAVFHRYSRVIHNIHRLIHRKRPECVGFWRILGVRGGLFRCKPKSYPQNSAGFRGLRPDAVCLPQVFCGFPVDTYLRPRFAAFFAKILCFRRPAAQKTDFFPKKVLHILCTGLGSIRFERPSGF